MSVLNSSLNLALIFLLTTTWPQNSLAMLKANVGTFPFIANVSSAPNAKGNSSGSSKVKIASSPMQFPSMHTLNSHGRNHQLQHVLPKATGNARMGSEEKHKIFSAKPMFPLDLNIYKKKQLIHEYLSALKAIEDDTESRELSADETFNFEQAEVLLALPEFQSREKREKLISVLVLLRKVQRHKLTVCIVESLLVHVEKLEGNYDGQGKKPLSEEQARELLDYISLENLKKLRGMFQSSEHENGMHSLDDERSHLDNELDKAENFIKAIDIDLLDTEKAKETYEQFLANLVSMKKWVERCEHLIKRCRNFEHWDKYNEEVKEEQKIRQNNKKELLEAAQTCQLKQ